MSKKKVPGGAGSKKFRLAGMRGRVMPWDNWGEKVGSRVRGAKLKKAWFDSLKALDVSAVESLAKMGANLEWRNASGETALTLCAGSKDVGMSRLMVGLGSGVETANSAGTTPLMVASAKGALDCVEYFLSAGGDVEARNASCKMYTAAFYAVHAREMRCLKRLAAAGIDMDAKTYSGDSMLDLACFRGDRESVEILIASGADLDARDSKGRTAMMTAARRGQRFFGRSVVASGGRSGCAGRAGAHGAGMVRGGLGLQKPSVVG